MSVVSNLLREGEVSDLSKLPILAEYHRIEAEYQAILKEFYPGTMLEGQELLKRVAAVVGLQLPKTVELKAKEQQ